MIVYLKNSEIDREQWDNCIRNSATARPYAYSWYLDIMAPGWEALIDDDYDSVFPVPSSIRFGIKYTTTPTFIQQLGAFSPDKPASETILEFLDYMPDIFKLTDLCVGQKVEHQRYKTYEKLNYEINLSSQYEKISERYSTECRKYVSRAAKKGFELTGKVSPEELADLCMVNKRLNLRRVKLSDYKRVVDLMYYCISNGKGSITGVRGSRKKLVYGIFHIKMPGSISVILEANTIGSIEKHIRYFIINEIIKDNAPTAALFDFAGTSDNLTVPIGKLFGGIEVPYYRIHRNRIFWPVRIMK